MHTGITGYIFFGSHRIQLHREHLEEEYKAFCKALMENEEPDVKYEDFVELAEDFVGYWNLTNSSVTSLLKSHIPGELNKYVVVFAAEYSSFSGVDDDSNNEAYNVARLFYSNDVDFFKLFGVNDADQMEWRAK